ncbi:MAG: PilZ domain-containing protein [Deltaproteobacteria bacterium]|nr:PilZ domain-containing protein [Deltaproteobacteria bacterium]
MGNGKDNKNGDYVLLRPDRRRDTRKPILVLRVTEARSNVFFGYAKNISRGGLFISTVNPRKVGEEFKIAFDSPVDGKQIICNSAVAWIRNYSPETKLEAGMGMRFLDLNEEERKTIDEWVKLKPKKR